MKGKKIARKVKVTRYSKEWQLHQRLGRLVEKWDRPLEQGELENLRPKSAPKELLPLLF